MKLRLPAAGSVFVVFGGNGETTMPPVNASDPGKNHLLVEITNLWNNRLAGDQKLPKEERTTRITQKANFDKLLESGLLGPVELRVAPGSQTTPAVQALVVGPARRVRRGDAPGSHEVGCAIRDFPDQAISHL